jgi:Transcriptional regulators
MSVSPDPGASAAIPHRVTQCDIARAAGVHNTTVSLALRNSPTIPETTRKRIQSLAQEMGYHRDPALQALVAYRKGRAAGDRRDTIAYVTNGYTRRGWQNLPADALFYAGALRKAAQLGYQIEHFWLGEPGMTAKRLSNVLFHRGINGVLLASHPASSDALAEFDWSRVSAVKIGCFPEGPALHRVLDDDHGAIRLAMRKALEAGYQRIGLVLPKAWDDAAAQEISATFFAEQNRILPQHRLPVFFCEAPDAEGRAVAQDSENLQLWLRRNRPQAILSSHRLLGGTLSELGVSIPHDLGFIDVFAAELEPRMAGVRRNCQRVGEVAAELLAGLIQQNTFGPAEVPTVTAVEGCWCEGDSLPAIGVNSSAAHSERIVLHASVRADGVARDACALRAG